MTSNILPSWGSRVANAPAGSAALAAGHFHQIDIRSGTYWNYLMIPAEPKLGRDAGEKQSG
jgi:hypothetical protein